MKIRQKHFTKEHFNNFLREHEALIEFFRKNRFKSDSALEEASQRAKYFQTLALDKLLATYTAGENIETLIPLLEDLVEKYEIRQKTLAEVSGHPKYIAIGNRRLA